MTTSPSTVTVLGLPVSHFRDGHGNTLVRVPGGHTSTFAATLASAAITMVTGQNTHPAQVHVQRAGTDWMATR